MNANRLSFDLGHCCPRCTSRQRLKDRLQAAEETCEQIERDASNTIEFIVPGLRSWMEGRRTVKFYVIFEPEPIRLADDIRQATAAQLRELGNRLCAAACALETNGGGV